MTNQYTQEFKENLVRRVCEPGGPSAYELANKVGVGRTTLYRWVQQSRSHMSPKDKERRPQDWSAAEKLEAVIAAEGLADEELGAFLRERGLHDVHLEEWRRIAVKALGKPGKAPSSGSRKEVKRLERELRRKEKALAEAAALLVLSKKARALWGDEGDSTP